MAEDGPKEGLAAAIGLLGAGAPPADDAEQLDLLPSLSLSPAVGRDGVPLSTAPGRPGRPRGARNRKTDAWVDYILSRYPSPLQFLAETYSRPVAQLARELSTPAGTDGKGGHTCTLEAAKDIQRKAAEAALPYLHQRLPIAVEVDHKSAGVLIVGHVSAAQAAAAGEVLGLEGLALSIAVSEQNQALIEGEASKSHGESLTDEPNG